jgi:hypothetical protein
MLENRVSRQTIRLVLAALLIPAAGACVTTMYVLEPPPMPRQGYIPSDRLRQVQAGQTAADVRAIVGEPLDVGRTDEREVWHYRVPTVRCTKITKRLLGAPRSTPPPEDPHATVTLRNGLVEAVEVVPAPTSGRRR